MDVLPSLHRRGNHLQKASISQTMAMSGHLRTAGGMRRPWVTQPPDAGLYGLARRSRLSQTQGEEDMAMATTGPRASAHQGPYHVLGTRPTRHDALDKVTGAARYGSDPSAAVCKAHPHAFRWKVLGMSPIVTVAWFAKIAVSD